MHFRRPISKIILLLLLSLLLLLLLLSLSLLLSIKFFQSEKSVIRIGQRRQCYSSSNWLPGLLLPCARSTKK